MINIKISRNVDIFLHFNILLRTSEWLKKNIFCFFLIFSVFKSSLYLVPSIIGTHRLMTSNPSLVMFHSSIKDCSTPSETGYDLTGTTATTYLGTSNVACATGYEGTASPAQIQCEASGSWTTVTGCLIKGKKYHFVCII